MFCAGVLAATVAVFIATVVAANRFLDASDDQPVRATFRGTEWGEEIDGDIPLIARVVTRRIAQAGWGAVFKVEFTDIESRAPTRREISPEYFVVTDDRIALLNESDNEAAARRIAGMPQPPTFDDADIYAIDYGRFTHADPPWTTTVEVKADRCIYQASHNSGHFKTVVWQKGVGLVEYAMGSGAHRDGFRLKRTGHR